MEERMSRDLAAHAAVHALLLRLAGYLPDRVLTDARLRLAAGRREEVAVAVAFEAVSGPLRLESDEIALLRRELPRRHDLAEALDERHGERPPSSWIFLSALRGSEDGTSLVVRPLDLTVSSLPDGVDRALVAEATAVPGVRAVWRAWRMPSTARSWKDPVRVAVVTVDREYSSLPELAAKLARVMVAAGDPTAQAEVCWAGVDAPPYQTMARSCGALLWASRPARPISTAAVFDGVDPDRGPWFTSSHPVVSDDAERQRLLTALRAATVISWSSARMTDVLNTERGQVVPMHLRTDGAWVWSEATPYYLEQYCLAPDPDLTAHLSEPVRPEPLDEISVHRALVYLLRPRPDEPTWHPSTMDGDRMGAHRPAPARS
jgi:hypothetical protein